MSGANQKLRRAGKPRLRSSRHGGQALSIHVERFNPALRLYERLGFRELEEKARPVVLPIEHD